MINMAVNNGYTSGFPLNVSFFSQKSCYPSSSLSGDYSISQSDAVIILQLLPALTPHQTGIQPKGTSLSTTPNRLKTHGYSVNSVLRGCAFHYPLLNVIILWVTTVNKEKRGWPSAMRPCIILSFPLKTSCALVTTLFKWYGLGLHLSTIQRDSPVPFSWHR